MSEKFDVRFVFKKRRKLHIVTRKKSFVPKRRNLKNRHRNFKNHSESSKNNICNRKNRNRVHKNRSYNFKNRDRENFKKHRRQKQYKQDFKCDSHFRSRVARFRISDVMKFDFNDINFTKRSIAFFIRRFYHIAEIENEKTILRILSMCFKNTILK